jgi:hypothetical protein
MPSTRPLAALAVALLVVTSGCSMLACGSEPAGPQPAAAPQTTAEQSSDDGPDYHEFTYGSFTGGAAYNATVTLRRGGEVVAEQTVESDGNGTYHTVARVSQPGEYEVTVNTSIPATGGGTKSDRFTVDAAPGNATAIAVEYLGIDHATFSLPREPLSRTVTGTVFGEGANVTVAVHYRGDLVNRTEVFISGETKPLVAPNGTGIYWVRATAGESEETGAFILTGGRVISVNLRSDGIIRCLRKTSGSYCT